MNIITEQEKIGRIEDGINTLLNLSDEQFEQVIEKLKPVKDQYGMYIDDIKFFYITDKCEKSSNPVIVGLEDKNQSRYYYGGKNIFLSELLKKLDLKKQEFSKESKEYSRIERLINSRNIQVYQDSLIEDYPDDKNVIKKLFEVLQNQNEYEKFLNYSKYEEEFKVNDKTKIGDYLNYIAKIFGNIKNEQFFRYYDIFTKFYISELNSIKEKVLNIYEKYNVERYYNKRYEFKYVNPIDEVIRRGNEPDWNVNPELKDVIFKNMPQELSIEEKAIYIYMKLCKELVYDEGYMYREKIGPNSYSSEFSKEKLESIKPGDKVTCFEVARLSAKMINFLDGDIEGVIVCQGYNKGHFLSGFYTDNISVNLELTNNDPINDITRARAGISLRGINANSDRQNILPGIIEKIHSLVIGGERLSTQEYMKVLKQLPLQKENPNILKTKLEAFIKTMKDSKIYGNEFTQLLIETKRNVFSDIEIANIGRKEGNAYKRTILIRKKKDKSEENNEKIYAIDTESLNLTECTQEEIIKQMKSGEFVYENSQYSFSEIDEEVQ